MAEQHIFQPWNGLPGTPVCRDPSIADRHAPHTDPSPMDPSWYAGYDPAADQALHESYLEDVSAVRPLLEAELDSSSAELTGHEVACVLATPHGVYSGHVVEHQGDKFITAPAMALAELEAAEGPDAEITGVYLMGRNVKKPKYIMPTPEDYDRLAERFIDWGPTIIIVDPGSADYTSVWASIHGPAYSVKSPSDFRDFIKEDEDVGTFPSLIAERTLLDGGGAQFVAHLMHTGRRRGLEIYLTGSASGRGEISNALKDDYEDIDLLIVAGENDLDEVERTLISRAEEYFGPLEPRPMTSYDYDTGRAFPGIYLYDAKGRKKVQMHIGRAMEDVNYRPDNFQRNFFHRVS